MPESTSHAARFPAPPSERGAWVLACLVGIVGVAVLVAVLTGLVGRSATVPPPPIVLSTPTPVAGSASASSALAGAARSLGPHAPPHGHARDTAAVRRAVQAHLLPGATRVHVSTRWMEGFYPIYATAQSTFGVNWLLLAAIHMQETAFSTAPSTYHGLNFARCCGGPMQFNVTNGRVTTWDLVAGSYVYGRRPASYGHRTVVHPSIYDDFDSIMAAAHLLSADGAGYALDGGGWAAAYDYYGHDTAGVLYADEVLARAIGWSQRGFCINCGVSPALVRAVHAAYGAPVLAALLAVARPAVHAHPRPRAHVPRAH